MGATDGTPVGRRVVLGLFGLAAAGVLGGRALQDAMSGVAAKDPTGLTSAVFGGFRYYSVTPDEPDVSAADYRLRVSGLVERPITLTIDDLAGMRQTRLTRDFQCVTGWRVRDVPWVGVALPDVLAAAGVRAGAAALTFTSLDGTYTESLTLAQARRRDVLVATSMLGKPVTRSHGGPVRLYVASMYGYKSLKWLDRIVVTDKVEPGYWERRGYDVDAPVGRSNGRGDDAT